MRRKQFEPLVIHDFEEQQFHLPLHRHTYYELVYIRKGYGVHLLNNNKLPYKTGDLFILSPEDEHHFDIKKSTRFTFIKFTDSYFASHKFNHPDAFLTTRPEEIMRNKMLKEVKLKLDEPCISILRNTVENIVAYNCRKDVALSPIVYFQVLSIFGLIREAAAKLSIRIDKGQPDKQELISYIHQHIYEPSLIQIKNIAEHFHIAPAYFSAYFKRNFEVSYRDYINDYRLKLIEKRIASGKAAMKQIADEFGFTDESHLSHYFKKARNMSPANYRKSIA